MPVVLPGGYHSPYSRTIAELMARQGDIQARGAEASGQIWGGAVQNLGQIAGQAVQQHQEEKIRKQRETAVNSALQNWNGDPRALFRNLAGVIGPEKAMDVARGAEVLLKPEPIDWKGAAFVVRGARRAYESGGDAAVAQSWPLLSEKLRPLGAEAGVEVPKDYTPGFGKNFAVWDDMLNKPVDQKAPERVEQNGQVFERQADGSWKQAVGLPTETPKPEKTLADIEAESEARARGSRRGAPPEGSTEKFWVVRDSKPIRITEAEYRPGDLPASTREQARPASGAEKKVLGFYLRGKEALETIEGTTKSGNALEQDMAKAGLLSQFQLGSNVNPLMTGAQRSYRQAQRAFTEARLRKESGAAVPDSEYENDAKTYFVQPGDGPAEAEQKQRARQKVLDGLKYESGRAFQEYFGEENTTPATAAAAAAPVKIKSIKQVSP